MCVGGGLGFGKGHDRDGGGLVAAIRHNNPPPKKTDLAFQLGVLHDRGQRAVENERVEVVLPLVVHQRGHFPRVAEPAFIGGRKWDD